jgi:ubiquinone/menaquinone biosynthesis C-methylase UbiE
MTTRDARPENSPDWGRYVLDNAAPQTAARFSALAELYDANTISHLVRIVVNRGWRCWEVGAGPGTIARWLAERVGPTGSVLATDLDTRFLREIAGANLSVQRHDVVSDPVPAEDFDVVHARLLLLHLPQREAALDRMIAALKPGGWLVVEEFDSVSLNATANRYPGETPLKSMLAFRNVMLDRGADPGFGRALAARLRTRGLDSISAEGRLSMSMGRSRYTELMKANFTQVREAMLATGLVTEDQFQSDLARLDADDFMMPSPIMWTVTARRPM